MESREEDIKFLISELAAEDNDFIQDVISFYNENGRLTDKQYSALKRYYKARYDHE